MASRYSDPVARLGQVDPDTPAAAKRRKAAARSTAVRERAEYLLDNDPDVNDMVTARRVAREQMIAEREFEALVKKGHIDPDTGKLTRVGREAEERSAAQDEQSKKKKSKSPRRGGRPTGRRRKERAFVRDTARTVTAPFGNAASAGWTAFQGGLSLVLLYVVLRDADTLAQVGKAIATGISRFGDPYTPLFPDRDEISQAKSDKKTATGQRPTRPTRPQTTQREGGYRRNTGGVTR